MDNAEELIKGIRGYIESLEIDDLEPVITPTMYDPEQLQNDVTILVLQKVEGGSIPKFKINVKDLEGIRNWNKVKDEQIKSRK